MPRFERIVACLLISILLTSCSVESRQVKPPEINPSAAAAAAIALYDQDGDGSLSEKEVETSAMTLELWDADWSGGIEREDIQERLERYLEAGVGMIGTECFVFGDQGPIGGAEVVFEPEEFLADVVKPASGTTEKNGCAIIAIAEEDREYPTIEATQIGLYRVRITHPKLKLRPEYNSKTKLSYEVCPIGEIAPPCFHVRS